MRPSVISSVMIGALVLIAIALGLSVAGGPKAGRLEKEDKVRAEDIARLAGKYVPCLAEEAGRHLPERLFEDDVCFNSLTGIRLADPHSGAPYRYERISDTRFRLCASFHRADRVAMHLLGGLDFDADTGCLSATYYGGSD